MAIEVSTSQFRHRPPLLPHFLLMKISVTLTLLSYYSAVFRLILYFSTENLSAKPSLGGSCSQILAFDTVPDPHAELVLV